MNNRREFLRRTTIMGAGLAVLSSALMPDNSLAKDNKFLRPLQPTNTSYKNDLRINSSDEAITITGKVFDHGRRSGLGNVTVEICHCDASGNFKRFGKFIHRGCVKTSNDGTYQIKTNVPGTYREDGISKSKRIFVKVSARGYRIQFSTLYLDMDNYPFIDSKHFQNSRMIDIVDLPQKVEHGKNSTIQYNHYLV